MLYIIHVVELSLSELSSDAPISISVYRYRLIGTKIEISVSLILLLILPILQTVIKY